MGLVLFDTNILIDHTAGIIEATQELSGYDDAAISAISRNYAPGGRNSWRKISAARYESAQAARLHYLGNGRFGWALNYHAGS